MQNKNFLVIIPNTRAYFALASLLSVGAAAVVLTCILAIAALAGLTVFVAILGYHLLIAVSGLAIASGPLTQVLLVLVLSWFLAKVYPIAGRGLCAAVKLFQGGM